MARTSKNQGQEEWKSVWKMQLSRDCFACPTILNSFAEVQKPYANHQPYRHTRNLSLPAETTPQLSLSLARILSYLCWKLLSPIFCREQKFFYMLSIIANVYPVLWPQTCPKFNPKRWFSVLLTASNWLIYEEASANPGVFQQARVKRSTMVSFLSLWVDNWPNSVMWR